MTQSSAVAREPSLGHHSEPSHHSYDLCSGDLPAIQEEPVWGLSSYLLIQCVSLWQLSSTMDSVHPAVSFVSLRGEMSLPKSRAVCLPSPPLVQSVIDSIRFKLPAAGSQVPYPDTPGLPSEAIPTGLDSNHACLLGSMVRKLR